MSMANKAVPAMADMQVVLTRLQQALGLKGESKITSKGELLHTSSLNGSLADTSQTSLREAFVLWSSMSAALVFTRARTT